MSTAGAGWRAEQRAPSFTAMAPPSSEALRAAASAVNLRAGETPRVGLVLGSGLGRLVDRLSEARAVDYAAIPGMPQPSVAGHAGRLWLGRLGEVPVACLSGRVHLYEGATPAEVVFGALLLGALGAPVVLLTNAAGGVSHGLGSGQLMLIEDHLNLTGQSPLTGPNAPSGPRFPDMTVAYDRELRALARDAAASLGISLARGVYAGLAGPSYETPAEIRMLRALGADAVGMSTVLETIALRHAGLRVGAVSCITNAAATATGPVLAHAEVVEAARAASDAFASLLTEWVQRIGCALGARGEARP